MVLSSAEWRVLGLGGLEDGLWRPRGPFFPFTLTLALSHRGFFAQLDVGAVARPNRPRVPVCPTPWIPAYAGMTVVVQSTHRGRGDGASTLPSPGIPCVRFAPRPLRFAKGTGRIGWGVDNWGMCAVSQRLTVRYFGDAKARGELIAMVTAYDANQGMLVDAAGIPAILVGDSLGNVVLGYDSTVPVTVEDMVRATAAVTRGAKRAFVVADMPFGSYQSDVPTAIKNAARLMKEGGAQSVKLEGGVSVEGTIRALVEAGIPVMGHVGFTPQSIHSFGGYRVQGRGENAERVIEDALAVERAGAYSVVLELMPSELSKEITERLTIPTIGIGAGPHCDGQIQVLHDMLGLDPTFRPRHAGRYGDLAGVIRDAVKQYMEDVGDGTFPGEGRSHYSR